MHQFRYAVRLLAKNPGFTAAAVVCLALGIGATTAIFTVVNAVLLRPLPYARAGQLVRVFTEFPVGATGGLRHFWVSGPEYFEIKRDTTAWNGFEFWVNNGVNLAGTSEPIRATASFVSWGMLPMLGVSPILGRTFTADEDRPGVPATAVISYGLWQRAYGGDRSVIGRDIRLNGAACTVLGVMPRGFAFPPGELDPPELWVAMRLDPANPGGRGGHNFSVLARLRDGMSLPAAQSEMQRYMQHIQDTMGQGHYFNTRTHTVVLAGFQEEVVGGVKRAMLVLLGAVAFVLLIACVNVANLLLARSEARRREIAVRAAIGAGLGRLLQQFVVEGLLLSLSGAALGMLLAFGGLRLLVATNAGSIPRVEEIGINWQVLLFTLGISILTGMTFGLAPVIHMRTGALHETLKSAAGRTTATVMANRFRGALVTSELALALVLLIGSGLMVKAFWKLTEVNSGIDSTNLLTLRFLLPASQYRDAAAIVNFHQALTARVRSLPGVTAAAIVSGMPPGRPINANTTAIEGAPPRTDGRGPDASGAAFDEIDYYNNVSAQYFESVGARLLDGRLFQEGDGASSNPVVVVNQTMARRYWPNESAVGHRVRNGPPNTPWRTIVGVVTDIKNAGLDRPTGTELYFPVTQTPVRLAYLFVKTKGDPLGIANAVRGEMRALDRALPISNLRTMDDVLDSARARPRFLTLVLTLFSSIALMLAGLGIYGVISYSVAQRTNEIGVRMALGAQAGDVLKLVAKTGLRFAAAGTALGAIGAFALTRTLSGLLFGVSSFDVGTFAAMAAALIAVTMLACWIPARRASKVDPLVALRYE